MSRRPLGASLPPADRLVAFESRIREYNDVVNGELLRGLYALDTGIDLVDDSKIAPAGAVQILRDACLELQQIAERPFRAPVKRPVDVDGPGATA